MTTNINFDDVVLVQSIVNATDSVMQLTKALETMRIELTDVMMSLHTFNNGISVVLAQAFKDTASEGITMIDVLTAVSESVSFLANAFTIITVASAVPKALTLLLLDLKKLFAMTALSVHLYTTSITGATAVTNVFTVVTGLLKMALDNLPFITFAVVIAAAISVLVLFVKHMSKASETLRGLIDDTEALKESTNELTKSLEESKAAYAASTSKIETNAGAAEILAQKIYALSEEENKSTEAKRQLMVLVNQLNETMPGLNLLYDEEADCLSHTITQVYALIQAKKEEFLQQAAAEKALELAKERLDVEQQLREVAANKAAWEAQCDEEGWTRNYHSAMAELLVLETDLTAKHAELGESFDIVTESIVTSASKQLEAVDTATAGIVEDYAEQEAAAQAAADAEAEALKQREEKLKSYTDTATNMFSAIERESETSVSDMIANLENNQQALADWSDGLSVLTERFGELSEDGINAGLLEALRKAGPESAGIINNMVAASDDELQRLNEAFATGGEVAAKALMTELGLPEVVNAGSDLVDNMAESVAGNANLERETVRLIQATLNSVSAEINNGGFFNAGMQIARGMAQGVRDGTSELVRAVREMAIAAVNAAHEALDIHSPSRLFRNEVGLMVAQGFSAGILDGLGDVSAAARQMSGVAADSLDGGFMRAMYKLSGHVANTMPAFATGRVVPAHMPYANAISNSDSHATTFHQNVHLTGNDMSDAQKLRLLQMQSRRMLRLGV